MISSSKRGCLGAAAAVAVVVLFALGIGGAGFQYVNSQPWFCNSCHEMNFYYASWQASTHGDKARCLECHAEPGIAGFIEEKARGAEQVLAHFRGDYPVPIRILVRVKNDQCLACHPETPKLQDGATSANHAVHIDRGVLCADCHSRITHADAARGEARVVSTAQCEECHQNHKNFPLLVGNHAQVDCSGCHHDGVYVGTASACESCHNPPTANHTGSGSGCQVCHSPAGWKPVAVDHGKTNFALAGRHQSVGCKACHGSPFAAVESVRCETCHSSPAANHPGQSTGCENCHSPEGWDQLSNVDHDKTAFPLTGQHVQVACRECHGSPFARPASTLCEICHQAPLTGHPAANKGCENCHTTAGWPQTRVDHAVTRFPLVGLHIQVACGKCHGDPFTTPKSLLCESCHAPPTASHPGGGTKCANCHTPNGWAQLSVNHNQVGFALAGQHLSVACQECHGDPFAKAASTRCEGCHKPPSANHPGGGANCATCHTPVGWKPVSVDHNQVGFALVGQHLQVTCQQCHGAPFSRAASTACQGCHQPPAANHPGGGANCEACHSPNGWSPANVDHNQVGFALTGQHAGLNCSQCHGSPFQKAASTLCEGCHQPPANHPGGNGSCQACHSPNGWSPATVDHNQVGFRLTGQHLQVPCQGCHGSPFRQAPGTNCAACHQPPASHAGMPATCEQCHTPNGFSPANFNHPHVGEHIPAGEKPLRCSQCHTGGVFARATCTGSGCHTGPPGGGD